MRPLNGVIQMELYKQKEWLEHQHCILKKPIKQIGEELNVNPRTVRYYKEKYNIETPKEVRYSGVTKYTVNDSYFNAIDDEHKAYWLGYIVADGSILSEECETKRLSFTIKEEDKEHLEMFKKDIGSDAPVTIKETSIKGYSSYKSAMLRINSSKLCDSLINLGVLPNKSTKEHYPNNIPEELAVHFWRGFVDGDGCITIYETRGKKQIQVSAIGSEETINEFHRFLLSHFSFRAKPLVQGKNFVLTVSGANAVKTINLLYGNSTVSLERKHKLYLEGLQLFSEDIV